MKKYFFTMLLVLVLSLAIYFRWFSSTYNVSTDLHLLSEQEMLEQFSQPYAWGSSGSVGFGEYKVPVLWNWPVNYLFGYAASNNLEFVSLIKFPTFILFLLSSILGIYLIANHLRLKTWAFALASICYVLNTYIILLIDGGQLNLALAYGFFALAVGLYLNYTQRSRFHYLFLFSLSTLLLSFVDIRIVCILAIVCFSFFITQLVLDRNTFFSTLVYNFILALFTCVIMLAFHAYWIVPSILARIPTLPSTFGRISQVDFLSFTTLTHALLWLSPHWYLNSFGLITNINPWFFIFPFTAFGLFLFKNKIPSRVLPWLILVLIGIFLSKGANPPFGDLYVWLFTNIPGFNLFRDSTKFFFILSIAYSLLIGYTFDLLIQKFRSEINIFFVKTPTFFILAILVLIFLYRPVWSGKMTGTLSEPKYQNEYLSINNVLKEDESWGRTIWIPTKSPLSYSSSTHPAIEANHLLSIKSFANGVVGSYEQLNYLRESDSLKQLLEISGVSYIGYQLPINKGQKDYQDISDYYSQFLSQIKRRDYIGNVLSDYPVALIKTKGNQDHIFLAKNIYGVIGSDILFDEVTYLNNEALSNNTFVFLDQDIQVTKDFSVLENTKIVLYKKQLLDLVASFISDDDIIKIAKDFDFTPNNAGIWKRESSDYLWTRNFLQEKYNLNYTDFDLGTGVVIIEGDKEYSLPLPSKKDGVLMIRALENSKGGSIEIYKNDELFESINTLPEMNNKVNIKLSGHGDISDQIFTYDESNLKWFEVGGVYKDDKLTLKTKGDINLINVVAIVSETELNQYKSKVENYNNNRKIINWSKLSEKEQKELLVVNKTAKLSYKRVSPVEYIVEVTNLDSPHVVIFSEKYDPLWSMEFQKSLISYGFLNGFPVMKDGIYHIRYYPQKFVEYGFIITRVTLYLICIVAVLILLKDLLLKLNRKNEY